MCNIMLVLSLSAVAAILRTKTPAEEVYFTTLFAYSSLKARVYDCQQGWTGTKNGPGIFGLDYL